MNYDREFESYRAGQVPKHRFFGYFDLVERGHKVLHCSMPKAFRKKLQKPIFWRIYQALYAVFHQRKIHCIVATHEATAIPILLLKRLRLLRTPVVVVNVALLAPKNLTPKKKKLWKWLLPCAENVLSYCSAQIEWLEIEYQLEKKKLSFVPLCVDTSFFIKSEQHAEDPFVLAVGTNEGKDYATLVKSLPENIKLVVATDDYNARIIEENSKPEQNIEILKAVPIETLKRYYEKAVCMMIPLHETQMSSGQTVLLENMALGKVIIISDVSSIRDYVKNNISAIMVPPGDITALNQVIREIWESPKQFENIGAQAAETVKQNFSSQKFAEYLEGIIEQVVTR